MIGALALVAAALGKVPVSEEEIGELPPWMTKGEEVRLRVIEKLLDSADSVDALEVIRVMRADGFDVPELDLLQGRALRMEGVTTEAERLLLRAQKRMARDPRPPSELCVLYADLQQMDDAIDRCFRATQVGEDNAQAWNNLSFLLLATHRAEEAVEAGEMAIQIDATQPLYRNNLALAQAALGRTDQAFRTLQSTMSRSDAAYMVGLAVERELGLEAARPWFDKALQVEPNHTPTRQHLAPETSPPLEQP